MTPEEMKRKLAILSTIEGAGGDISHQPLEDVTPAEQPAPAPQYQIDRVTPPAPAPDTELAAAKGEDVNAFNDRATETALRQIVGGITRTSVPDSVSQLGTSEKDLLGHRRQAQLDALRQMEAGNNAARTNAYLENTKATGERAAAGAELAGQKFTLEKDKASSLDARERAKLALAQEDEARKKAADAAKAKKGSGKAPAARDANGNLLPTSFRDQLRGNAIALRPDEELIDPKGIGYRDPDQAKRADTLRGNLEKLQEHRQQANDALAEYHAAKTMKEKDDALVKLNIAMSNAASMTRQAEQMGSSIDAQHNIDKMMSTVGGDVKNWQNFVNEGRIDAALGASVKSAGANVDGQLSKMNVRVKKATPAISSLGKVMVSNGKETLEIDEGDVAAAEKDGYRRVGK